MGSGDADYQSYKVPSHGYILFACAFWAKFSLLVYSYQRRISQAFLTFIQELKEILERPMPVFCFVVSQVVSPAKSAATH